MPPLPPAALPLLAARGTDATSNDAAQRTADVCCADHLCSALVAAVAPLTCVEQHVDARPDPADVLRNVVAKGDVKVETPALYGVDVGVIAQRYVEFVAALPRVTPHYAVKCNPDPVVVRTLAFMGANFDCASMEELELVAVAGDIPREELDARVVYANPCKQASHLRHAAEMGVRLMTFDGEDELLKIRDAHGSPRLLLRIAVEDSASLCPLSSKYGASMEDVQGLLQAAVSLSLDVVGVAFHVGSGCRDVMAYVNALYRARRVFDEALQLGIPPLSVLDIGGGFPGYECESVISFSEAAAAIGGKLEDLFDSSIHVIAEPGRYFVAAAYSLATQVLSRRKGRRAEKNAIVIGDGVYGSFKDALLLNLDFRPQGLLFRLGGHIEERDDVPAGHESNVSPTTLYGPTCDARDVVARDISLPSSVSSGDWLYFTNMGAYTISLATSFNSMPQPRLHYYIGSGVCKSL